jgi:hypothetical protein
MSISIARRLASARSASSAAIGAKTATSIDATLAFAGSAETARVRWTFVDRAVVQVQLSDGKATSITEAFVDPSPMDGARVASRRALPVIRDRRSLPAWHVILRSSWNGTRRQSPLLSLPIS